MTPVLIIPAPIGQLGNRLTHFAHVLAFAIERRIPLLHTAFHPYADAFTATSGSLFSLFDPTGTFAESALAHRIKELFSLFLDQARSSFPHIDVASVQAHVRTSSFGELDRHVSHDLRELVFAFGFVLRTWIESNAFASIPGVYIGGGDDAVELDTQPLLAEWLAKPQDSLIVLDGWGFRCTKGFARWHTEIASAFSPLPTWQAKVLQLITPLRYGLDSKRKIVVGLHIRRGDYQEWQGGHYFFSWEQYEQVARAIVNQYGMTNTSLLICSNEPLPERFLNDISYVASREDAVVDMYALGACDLIVGPPSTFTGWPAVILGTPLCNIISDGTVSLPLHVQPQQ